MNRIVVVSNRVPLPEKGAQAGGLATALQPLLEREGGVWFGWSGSISAKAAEEGTRISHAGRVTYATMALTKAEHDGYYANFANGVLWPLFHSLPEMMRYDRSDAETYFATNARFADTLLPLLQDGDLVWVHDYHFLPLAGLLRARGVANPIGFFLHIPFPSAELLALAPPAGKLIAGLLQADVIGFQTSADLGNFAAAATTLAGARQIAAELLEIDGRRVRLGVFPAEIDAEDFAADALRAARSPTVERLRRSLGGQCLILGVDRLDPTKGLVQRLAGYRRFLETETGWHRRVTFLQIAPVSRQDVASYQTLRAELSQAAGEINSECGDPDWTPLRLITKGGPRATLAGYMRAARVGLVTPLRDGMNLVAKEYVAAQDPRDPGVLVLSRFAGAARQLDAALLVNPNDPDAIAEAITRALAMDLRERQTRWRAMWQAVAESSPLDWGLGFLRLLQQSPGKRAGGIAPALAPRGKPLIPIHTSSNAIN
jgi:trehalose 6-phosphate synthase